MIQFVGFVTCDSLMFTSRQNYHTTSNWSIKGDLIDEFNSTIIIFKRIYPFVL